MTILQMTATVTSRYLMIAESDETARILSTSATNINATIESEPLIAERSSNQRRKKNIYRTIVLTKGSAIFLFSFLEFQQPIQILHNVFSHKIP